MEFPRLRPDEIEVKVKKVFNGGFVALLYKTARVDMAQLDAVVGPTRWKNSYREVKGNLYCEISIYDPELKEWISKEDCGIESREDDEGNQKKGEASDAFKRAGFRWGIGRELYTAPSILIKAETKEAGSKHVLTDPFADYVVSSIDYDDTGKIIGLSISCKGKTVFQIGGKAEPVPQVITQAQQEELRRLCTKADGTINMEDAAYLKKIYEGYGYKKAKDILQKDYDEILNRFAGRLPWDKAEIEGGEMK